VQGEEQQHLRRQDAARPALLLLAQKLAQEQAVSRP